MLSGQAGRTQMINRRDLIASGLLAASFDRAPAPRGAQLAGNAFIISGFPAGGMGDLVSRPLAERMRGRYADERAGRKQGRRRRPDRGQFRQARAAGRARDPADSVLGDDALSAHLQESRLRPVARLRAGHPDGDLCVLVHRERGAARDGAHGRGFRRLGARQSGESRATEFPRPDRHCTSPA